MGAGGTVDGALDGRSNIRGRSKQVSLRSKTASITTVVLLWLAVDQLETAQFM